MKHANTRVALGLSAAAALIVLSTATADALIRRPTIAQPGTDLVLTPVPPPQPTPVAPFAVPSIEIIKREGTSLRIKWCDRSSQDTKHALFQGTDPETADDVIAAQLTSPTPQGCREYSQVGLTPDKNYCFRIAPMDLVNSVMIDYLSGTVCAYTREAESRPVWRIEAAIRTGSGTDNETDSTVRLRLNDRPPPVFSDLPKRLPSGNETWLDYGRDDFERGRTDRFDVNTTGISEFGDIHGITFALAGDDAWCLSSVSLFVNGVRVYNETRSPCVWSFDGGGAGSGFFFVSHDKLRAHPLWQSYETPELVNVDEAIESLANGEPIHVLTIPRAELESRIEGTVGHAIAFNSLEWGELEGSRFVEVTATDADPQVVHVDLDLEADIPASNPEVDIDFDLRFAMNCRPDGNGIDFGFTTENFLADADDSLFDEFIGLILCTVDAQCHPTMMSYIEKQIREKFQPLSRTISIQSEEAVGACNGGLLPTVVVTEEADVVLQIEPGVGPPPTPSPTPQPYGNIRDGFIVKNPVGGLLRR
jgi:hypothetical protein